MQSSQDIEFKVGDKAVYPAQGVAEVISIDEKDIAGQRQRFYVLRILDTDRRIMVPVSMHERYTERRGTLECEATYSNFRRFDVVSTIR